MLQGRLRAQGRNTHGTSRLVDAFDTFDRNASGFLDYRELRDALQHHGVDVTTQEAKEVLAAYDDEPDGKMDRGEFAELCRDLESNAADTAPRKEKVAKSKPTASGKAKKVGGTTGTGATKPLSGKAGAPGSKTGVDEVFAQFDHNDSGFLDYRELRDALRHYGIDVTLPEAQAVLALYDDNPDGKLDKKEFGQLARDIEAGSTRKVSAPRSSRPTSAPRSALTRGGAKAQPAVPARKAKPGKSKASNASVDDAFAKFDGNDSGFLDYRELRDALRHYGIDVTLPEAQAVLALYDDNPDGKLDKSEFAKLISDIEAGSTRKVSAPRSSTTSRTARIESRTAAGAGARPIGSRLVPGRVLPVYRVS